MSLVENLQKIQFALTDSVAALIEKEVVGVPEKLKLSEIPPWIDKVEGSGVVTPPVTAENKQGGTLADLTSAATGVKHIVFSDVTPSTETTSWGDCVKWVDGDTLNISTSVTGSKAIMPASCKGMFSGNTTIESVDFRGAVFPDTTDFSTAFSNCTAITSIDLSNQEMALVTSMSESFRGCSLLSTLNLSGSTFPSLTNLGSTFRECPKIVELDLSGMHTEKVTTMYRTFNGCSTLQTLDLSNWNTPLVTNMNGMFLGCSGLLELDLSNFDIGAVTDAIVMFENCSKLTTIYAKEWYSTKNEALDGGNMFANCTSLPNYSAGGSIEKAKWTSNGGYFTNPALKG